MKGDSVLLPGYGGTEVKLGKGQEFLLFRESEILAKLEK
jgi:co-chaperonin GroES (HSP10)